MRCVGFGRVAVLGLTLILATLSASGPISATTLVNADTKAYELRIEARSGGRVLSVAPEQKVEDLCPEGCTMTVVGVDDATYRLEGTEIVTIETGGIVYYDGQIPKDDDTTAGEAAGGKTAN